MSRLTFDTLSRSHHDCDDDGDDDGDDGDDGSGGGIAPMVKVAEAPRGVVVVGALRVQLLDALMIN